MNTIDLDWLFQKESDEVDSMICGCTHSPHFDFIASIFSLVALMHISDMHPHASASRGVRILDAIHHARSLR